MRKLRFRKHRRNPFGEALMVAGGNPARRHRRSRVVHQKRTKASRRHSGGLAGLFRKNPVAVALGGPMEIGTNIPYIATGALSAVSVAVVPSMIAPKIGLSGDLGRIGLELGTAILGGLAISMAGKKNHGAVFALVGSGIAVADGIKTYLLKPMGFLSDYEIRDYEVSDIADDGDSLEDIGAFPDTGMGAFPSTSQQYY